MKVTREMIGAAHDICLKKGDFVLSADLLERIYLAMDALANHAETSGSPLNHPAPAVPEIKPHQIAKLVNELRDIAIKYHDHQSLRERLAKPVHDLWRHKPDQLEAFFALDEAAHAAGLIGNTASAVPEGWQLVPKEPTAEMELAGKHSIKGAADECERNQAICAYKRMISAAPTPGEVR